MSWPGAPAGARPDGAPGTPAGKRRWPGAAAGATAGTEPADRSAHSGPRISSSVVARAATWAGFGQVVSQVSWFASLLILAALVPPRSFGLVSAGMVIVNIAILLVGSGTRGSIIVSERVTTEHLRYALFVNVGAALLATAGVMLLAQPIVSTLHSGADAGVLQGLILSVGVFAISVVPMAVLQREMRFKQEASVRAGSAVVASVVAVAAALLGAGVWALVIRQVLNSALMAVLAWFMARRLLPGFRHLVGRVRRPERVQRPEAGWFFLLAMFNLAAMSVDYLIVGHLTNPTQLGLYSLAFTLAFAPLTQFSWRLGTVILPAVAATDGAEAVARRTIRAVSAAAAILLPLVPVAMVLAPWLIPAVFGDKWTGTVTPFEILLPVGVAHAIVNMVGESLSGTGNVDFATRMQALWMGLMVPALVLLVRADGIVGASWAHLIVAVPIVTGYMIWGTRRVRVRLGELGGSLRALLIGFAAQAAATLAILVALEQAHAPLAISHAAAAVGGLAVAAAMATQLSSQGLSESRRLVLSVVSRAAAQS